MFSVHQSGTATGGCMEERTIREIIVQSSPHGRKMVNLAVVLESLRAMAQDSEPRLHSKDIFPVEIDEDTLTPETTIIFIMEGDWGS
jgi:ABC-type Fe2+-enterobactin transport system substrate-binding protein